MKSKSKTVKLWSVEMSDKHDAVVDIFTIVAATMQHAITRAERYAARLGYRGLRATSAKVAGKIDA